MNIPCARVRQFRKFTLLLQMVLLCLCLIQTNPAEAQQTSTSGQDLKLHRRKTGSWVEEFQVNKKDTSVRQGAYSLKIGTLIQVTGQYENGVKAGVWKKLVPDGTVTQIYDLNSKSLLLAEKEPLNFELSFSTKSEDTITPPVALLPLQYIFSEQLSSFSRSAGTSQMKILIGVDENDRVSSLDVVYISAKKTETKSFEISKDQRDHIISARVNGLPVKCMVIYSARVTVLKNSKYPVNMPMPPTRRLPAY